jgi:thiamine phosphate synthase YjbQ (UPF0047 family)
MVARDEMMAHVVISPARAAHALRTMLENNARLPQRECQLRFGRWEAELVVDRDLNEATGYIGQA